MNAKKKDISNLGIPLPTQVTGEIRLRPSTSDYETFAKTTALAMGKTGRSESKSKPNMRLLSLLNLGS